jgi:hypothetical protein
MQGLIASHIHYKAHVHLFVSHCNAHTRPKPNRRGLLTMDLNGEDRLTTRPLGIALGKSRTIFQVQAVATIRATHASGACG